MSSAASANLRMAASPGVSWSSLSWSWSNARASLLIKPAPTATTPPASTPLCKKLRRSVPFVNTLPSFFIGLSPFFGRVLNSSEAAPQRNKQLPQTSIVILFLVDRSPPTWSSTRFTRPAAQREKERPASRSRPLLLLLDGECDGG